MGFFNELSTLDAILRDGVYLSQFATGTSNGGLTAHPGGDRWEWEHRIFGGAYDSWPATHRPVYGALGAIDDPYGPAPRFGSAHLRLRSGVLNRTTFAYPDSTYGPTEFGVVNRMGLLASSELSPMPDPLDRYVEAHVHGRVRVPNDVEALVLDPSFQGTALPQLARSAGLVVEWHAGYRAQLSDIAANPAYRGAEVVQLARQLAREEVLTPALLSQINGPARPDPQLLKKVWHYIARYGASDAHH